MDVSRNELLGEIATDASLERRSYLVEAADQFRRFLAANADRIKRAGGLVLIDEEPDYLAIAPDGTFRSRTRYHDDVTGEWVAETEEIESPAEIVELYNPAELYAAFAEAARTQAGLEAEPTAAGELVEVAGLAPDETVVEEEPYAEAADAWAAAQEEAPEEPVEAARRLYDLTLAFQERSQQAEAHLVEQFEDAAESLAERIGDLIVIDEADERLTLTRAGRLVAEVVPEAEDGRWRTLDAPDALVEFYDPTDVFGDLADALAEAYPEVTPDGDEEGEEADEHDEEDSDEEDSDEEDSDEEDSDEDDGEERRPAGPES